VSARISVLIPTYERHEVLVETVQRFLQQEPEAEEIVVVDQTPRHPDSVELALRALEDSGRLRRIRRRAPSVPGAMNDALVAARSQHVVFCDDDVLPAQGFLRAHLDALERFPRSIVAGQVLQPGEEPEPLEAKRFAFRSCLPQMIGEFIGCNFSASRKLLLELGGFDEAFVAAAYRYERELSDRAARAGASVQFEPAASLRHLRAPRGGTRAWGNHLTTARPSHAVGDYYYLLRARGRPGRWRDLALRPFRAVRTRHHLRRPWWIPVTVFAELSGLVWALALSARGARLLPRNGAAS
jgi:GT2 family glycosyltransferase